MAVFSTTADLASLPDIRDHVLARAREAGLSSPLEPKLDLVLEEILVNVATHAYGGQAGKAEIECSDASGAFCVTVRDWGTPFDPLAGDIPEMSTDIDDRPIGGVGLLLVTTMTDSCSYARANNANELTFCFSL